jgi:NTE family protein
MAKAPTKSPQAKSNGKKQLNLALQGGGAHGAYTWGVLDRLLEEEDLEIHALSGTSAGAMNAAVMASGFRKNGAAGAKDALRDFWSQVSFTGAWINPVRGNPVEEYQKKFNLDGDPSYAMFDMMTRMFSPYQFNPFNLSPLRNVLENVLDLDAINAGGQMPIFITATNVHTGQARVFECQDVTVDVLLASACIPFYFQAVMVDDVPYWDGGYMGNPSIWPLIYNTHVHDVLLVQINPIYRNTTPKSAQDIINRLNEISFNASLCDEMRAMNFVKKLIREGKLSESEYKDMRMHMIPAPDIAYGLDASSKMNTDWVFFEFLHGIGRAAAETWLHKHKAAIGVTETVDIPTEFLGVSAEDAAAADKGKPKISKKPTTAKPAAA